MKRSSRGSSWSSRGGLAADCQGSGSVLAAGLAVALAVVCGLMCERAAHTIAHHKAQVAAELGAVAGAWEMYFTGDGCGRAALVVAANGGAAGECSLVTTGEGVDVVITARVGRASATARAGPVAGGEAG